MSYRIDFLLRFLFVICYFILTVGFLKVVFSKVNRILDWTWEEALLFLAVYQLLWSVGYVFFFEGLREFCWQLVRLGNLDFILLRPINPRFQISFSKPSFNDFSSIISSVFLFIYALGQLKFTPVFLNIFFFIFGLILAIILYYLFAFIISTFGLWAGQSGYVLEVFDRTVEFSQYPTDIFKGRLYFMFYTFIPIALFSFLPSRFLLGRASFGLIIIPIMMTIILLIISKLLFNAGLKHYSSASS